MRAFLSHSSKDKPFVEAVARAIGGAQVELDSHTFEFGLLNSAAIEDALKRSDLFTLFVSRSSLESSAVKLEAALAGELVAKGLIERLLFICIDEAAFEGAHPSWKSYNFVRREGSVKSAARLIQGTLLGIRSREGSAAQRFVGRTKELETAKDRLIDPSLPDVQAIFVSGNTGVGRRTFAKRLYADVYPHIGQLMPEIAVDRFDGLPELYRKIRAQLIREETVLALAEDHQLFMSKKPAEQVIAISEAINRISKNREAIILRDHGGMLEDAGSLQPHIKQIIEKVDAFPNSPLVLIADRTPPFAEREAASDVVFCPLQSLDRNSVRQLIALRLKDIGVRYDEAQLDTLVKLSDYHPFNINFIVLSIESYSLPVFLADPSALTAWKHRRTAEFIASQKFSQHESSLLAVLRNFPALDFSLMVESTDIPIDAAAKAIVNLIDRHVVETASDTYFVSPPLQAAIDRDGRFKLPPDQLRSALETIGNSLVAAGPDSPVPMSMVDSGILARLQSKEGLPELFTVFLLPSHLVWLARRRYDERNYPEAIELSRDALSSLNRLSTAGAVEASRILGLAAARKGRKDDFQYALDVLRRLPETPFTRSNANFIRGFNARLEGYLPQAEGFQRAAYRDAPRNFSVVRELAFICLARGNLQDAETYARRALEIAPDNQFILDVLVGSLIQKMKSQGRNAESEIEDLLERLERASPDDRRSFYETRRAEYELARGRAVESSRLIDLALAKTPHLFNVHALRARILMARGNRTAVAEELQKMNYLVRRPTGEGKSNLRALLDIQADYHAMCGDFTAARRVYDYQGVFDEKEKEQAMRRLDSAEGYARLR